MPPVLFTFLATPMTKLAHLIFPTAMANGVIAGAFVFCKIFRVAYHRPPLTFPRQQSPTPTQANDAVLAGVSPCAGAQSSSVVALAIQKPP